MAIGDSPRAFERAGGTEANTWDAVSLFDLHNFPPESTETPIPVECLQDLEILVREEPDVQVIHLRALDKLREAPTALSILSTLCSDYRWKSVGGINSVSKATEIDEELEAIDTVTLPRLKVDIQDEVSRTNHGKLMQPLVLQTKVIKKMALQLGGILMSRIDQLLKLINNLCRNLPISDGDINEIASLLQDIRDSPVRLDGVPATLLMAIDALAADVKNATVDFYSFIGAPYCKPSDIEITKIRLHARAICNSAVRLDERVREEGLLDTKGKNKEEEEEEEEEEKEEEEEEEEEEEGVLDATEGGSSVNIADAFQAIRNSALRMAQRVEQGKQEEEEGVLKTPNVGYSTIMDTNVVFDLKEIRLQLQTIRNSTFCLDEQVCGEVQRQEDEGVAKAEEEKKDEDRVEPAGSDP